MTANKIENTMDNLIKDMCKQVSRDHTISFLITTCKWTRTELLDYGFDKDEIESVSKRLKTIRGLLKNI